MHSNTEVTSLVLEYILLCAIDCTAEGRWHLSVGEVAFTYLLAPYLYTASAKYNRFRCHEVVSTTAYSSVTSC